MTGNATFDYHAQRTTTVDKLETKTFKDGEKTTITNGRVLDITSGGDVSNITGDQKLALKGDQLNTLTGSETTHIEGRKSETVDQGALLNITSGGKKEIIKDNVAVSIDGEWAQTTTGSIKIESPQQITIRSGMKVFIDSPVFERNDVQKNSFAQDMMDYMANHISYSVGSVAFKTASYAMTGVDVSHKGFTFGRTLINAQRVEAARVDSGSLRTALFALHMLF